MTALQKPPKHNPHKTGAGGHEGTRSKNLHIQTFVTEIFSPGGHSNTYWLSNFTAYFHWLAEDWEY